MKTTCLYLLLPVFLLSFIPASRAQKSKERQKEIARYWKQELRLAKKINHGQIARLYPEIGWLSGLWCMDGEEEPRRHYEILGKDEVRLGTRGYTAEDKKQVFIPESLPMGEFMGKPVVVKNGPYYELWSYSGDGKGLYGPVWWVYMERIKKISENEFHRVYATNYTYRQPTLDLLAFAEEESAKISTYQHYKKPRVYRKCR